jgi:hypothetical protein
MHSISVIGGFPHSDSGQARAGRDQARRCAVAARPELDCHGSEHLNPDAGLSVALHWADDVGRCGRADGRR